MNTIGWAVKQMQDGQKVRRSGWNGKGMFIVLMSRLQLPPYNTRQNGSAKTSRLTRNRTLPCGRRKSSGNRDGCVPKPTFSRLIGNSQIKEN